tara:strand:+ start:234 stop:1379 length:1146 start_codon:yes stop_codon:yes gene_type:complete
MDFDVARDEQLAILNQEGGPYRGRAEEQKRKARARDLANTEIGGLYGEADFAPGAAGVIDSRPAIAESPANQSVLPVATSRTSAPSFTELYEQVRGAVGEVPVPQYTADLDYFRGIIEERPPEPSYTTDLASFETMLDEIKPTEPDYSDLDRFEAMLEELNPAPDPNVTRGRALMALGQGLLGAPTLAGGLAAGAESLGDIYGDDAAAQREYNKTRLASRQALMQSRDQRAQFGAAAEAEYNKSRLGALQARMQSEDERARFRAGQLQDYNRNRIAARSALMDVEEARAVTDADRRFRARNTAASLASSMFGDLSRSSRLERNEKIGAIQDEIERLTRSILTELDGEEKAEAQKQKRSLEKKLDSLIGLQATRTLTATPAP